ncbi:hypothetical protein DF016_10950 [Burkholderia stagnalis]|uniref:Uncharacterized protein n=2 Tax=Burkholderia stagnalis TaxID=1503054 RepID=A0ABX9YRK7_9BURK|nr:hypothetical protein [Burkholderia stagnalis]RQY93846.1 hypothetical protein DF017_12530 [Burkholderia stagnalis]RQZ19568.1 hypothetical protein DF016_10950 [Burkholderia stagnalis]
MTMEGYMGTHILGTWPAADSLTTLAARLITQLRTEPAKYAALRADELVDWQPVGAECHDNADAWVSAHPGDAVRRGWLYQRTDPLPEGLMHVFVAHSVVLTSDDELTDVTLGSLEPTGRFLQHPDDVGGFFGMLLNPVASPKEFKVLEAWPNVETSGR